ncbi:phenylacetate-CoA ligase [Acidipila rosea]|uniref:Phenylacetate-CoA ligase n=1 Tax=Acidipila rosea TaxID=768535 RepID=A0A4R1LF97_9BACT|nr:phenylacetate-CoA ligase [Acidipila rosea]
MEDLFVKHGSVAPSKVGEWITGKVIYPLWTRRDHPHYLRHAKQFSKTQFLSTTELEQLQMERLREQLIHAFRNISFYRRRFESEGITPLDIRTLSDLRYIPILTKKEIQDHAHEMVAQNQPATARIANQTGGSTGSPLQFWVDRERFDSRRASTDRHNSWAGLHPGQWYAHLWGSRFDTGTSTRPAITWRQRLLYRALTLNTSLISEQDLAEYVALLRRFRPRFMLAYAQSAVMFARYCEQENIRDIHFESIITTAEMLLPEQRQFLERIFKGKVFNRYGCREFSVIASECAYHTGMHINADALIVEIEPSPHAPQGTGKVIVTDLLNRSMPLIRYEIGDMASMSTGTPCPCGRSLPRISEISGRITDFLITPDQRRISGISLALLAGDMPEVRQMQFEQTDRWNIRLRVVPGRGFGHDTTEELRTRLEPYLRGMSNLSIETVDTIASEPSGKFRYVKTSAEVLGSCMTAGHE